MTSGKSTVGGILSKKLGFDFVDLDDWIEVETRLSIPNYFKKFGEDTFRLREKDILEKSLHLVKYVVATGGGTPCFFDNLKTINEKAISVYIKVPPETIFGRLKKQKATRPLVAKLSESELKDYVFKTLEERAPFYEQATHVFELKNENKTQIANKIFEMVK